MEKLGHLVVASGGTGGHFYPALAVARGYHKLGGKVTVLVSGQQAAHHYQTCCDAGLDAREITTVRRPAGLLNWLLLPFRAIKCWWRNRKIIKELQGDILLGMGSFAAAPPCYVWPWRKKPLILHEGNTLMGRTNRFFASRAKAIALSLPLHDQSQLCGAEGRITGMPLRNEVVTAAENPLDEAAKNECLTNFGLHPGRKTVLVFGGSQGAQAINRLLTGAAALLADLKEQLQFILLTGSEDNAALSEAFRAAGLAHRIAKSDPDIHRCYQVADLTLCRGGASSICELALFRMPMVIIPLPTAADNHQFYNAKALSDLQAARCLLQSQATPELLAQWLREWLTSPAEWTAMGQRAKAFAHPDATDAVIRLLVEAGQQNHDK